ncbi:hypothetical protein ACQP1G_26340 [Nocardia sp. CA-107356]|uniref:hypothetical protein n=1 Tax=Nocardia sp. CA-107356 TaxID=3239972 RepID=UPI003D9419A0
MRATYSDAVEMAADMGFRMYMQDYFARPGAEERYLGLMLENVDVDLIGVGPGS